MGESLAAAEEPVHIEQAGCSQLLRKRVVSCSLIVYIYLNWIIMKKMLVTEIELSVSTLGSIKMKTKQIEY